MYSLKVYIDSEWQELEIGDNAPAIVFQINDLNQLQDRNASYSQSLKIPRSQRNRKILRFADVFQTRSQVPYRRIPCRLYDDGVEIIGSGYRLRLLKITEYFECQIVSDAPDLFSILKELTPSDLSLPTPRWTIEDLQSSGPNGVYYYLRAAVVEPTNEMGRGTESAMRVQNAYYQSTGTAMNNRAFAYPMAYTWPYVNFLELVKWCLERQGFTLDTDIEDQSGYRKHWISLAELQGVEGNDFGRVNGYITSTGQSAGGTERVYLLRNVAINSFQLGQVKTGVWLRDPEREALPNEQNYGVSISAVGSMKARFTIRFTSNGTSDNSRFMFRVRRYSGGPWAGYYEDNWEEILFEAGLDDDSTISRNQTIVTDYYDFIPGERIFIEGNILSGSLTTLYTATLNMEVDPDYTGAIPGAYIDIGKSLGFKTQEEILKTFIQLYGLSVEVNRDTNIVQAYTFNKIDANLSADKFLDWSDKVDMGSASEKSFKFDSYGQQSRILFQENTDFNVETVNPQAPFQDIGIIEVRDENLDISKDLFTIPIQSAQDIERAYFPFVTIVPGARMTADVRYFRTDADRGYRGYDTVSGTNVHYEVRFPATEWKAGKNRIVYAEDSWPEFVPYAVYAVPSASQAAPQQRAFTEYMQHFIDTYYGTLTRIANNFRIVELEMVLSPFDIKNINLFMPIYLEQYREYFYIQKINNYRSGEKVKVTLVCLNTIQ